MDPAREYLLERILKEAWPTSAWSNSYVVLAVSGGPDSVGLLRAMLAVKQRCGGDGRIIVAHFNHLLRGTAAEADQAWLESLCQGLGVPLEVGRADAAAISDRGDGWEAAARAVRYQFLRETAEKLGARYVAVAHTADDQAETVLHRIVRGTGLDGLSGMLLSRPLSSSIALVRPLLAVSRASVLEYLDEIGQAYRIDASNADLRWTRNRLRHVLLPTLREEFNVGVDDALLRLAAQARETQVVIADRAKELARSCVSVEPAASPASRVRIDCSLLAVTPALLVREVCKAAWQQAGWPLQAIGFAEWQRLEVLILGERNAPANLPGNVRARRDGHMLILELLG